MIDRREYVEKEFINKEGRSSFIIIYPHEEEVFLDASVFPEQFTHLAFLEGKALTTAVGENKDIQKIFIPLDLLIDNYKLYAEDKISLENFKVRIFSEMETLKSQVEKLFK